MRKLGLVPWEWILDETRDGHDWQIAATVAEYIKDAVQYARIDAWDGARAPLIICEARATKGVLERIAGRYLVPITATNGQVGGSLHTDVALLLEDNDGTLVISAITSCAEIGRAHV